MSTDPSIWGNGAITEEVLIPGPPGPPPQLVQGATSETTGAPQATLTKIEEGVYRIDWVLKTGQPGTKGNTGATGTVASATVEMIPHDQPATVTVAGTPPNQTMHFKLPRQTPTPGVEGPPGKLQNVRGTKPTDQDAIDLYAEGGPPDTVLLKVLKSTDTIKVFESSDGIITFEVDESISSLQPFKPSQISYINSASVSVSGSNPFIVPFTAYIPEIGESKVEVPSGVNEYIVADERFIRINTGLNIEATNLPITATVSLSLSIMINEDFVVVPVKGIANIPPGAISADLNFTSAIIPVATGDKIQIVVQSSDAIGILSGSTMQIERFF